MDPVTHVDESTITQDLVRILEEMTSDWDTGFAGGIGPDTFLVRDLGCESIDVVQFVVAIEECFQRRDLPIEKLLMIDGRYVDDLRVGDVVTFLRQQLQA
jgi:acyl carrier protein